MSRIHDALQRAEQEKLAAGTASDRVKQVDSTQDGFVEVGSPVPGLAEQVAAGLATTLQEPVSPATSLSDLVSSITPSVWSPDSRRLLFWSVNGHAHEGEEEFRTLRSRLYRIREKQPLKTVLVGSAIAGEGKTFVTANLGQVLARQRSRRVLMIDCDLRKPELHAWFGASSTPGITDYLSGDLDEAAVLQRSPKDNLYLISAGKNVSNPAELLGNGRLSILLDRIRPAFDWIVFDTPPILPVADASQVATACDGVLLVVLAGSTSFELAQSARREFRHAPAVLGVVLNRLEKNQRYGSYYYDYRPPQAETK